jgi:glycosyltransferase involved in cell wall biosynthesis
MKVAFPAILKVCLMTPYAPQQKGVTEYARMVVEALRRSPYKQRLRLRVISEITKHCPKSRTLLYPPEENFVLERVHTEEWPYSNLSFLKISRAILEDKPHIAHFYWPGGYGGFLSDFTGELLLILFTLLRLLSIRVVLTLHVVWFPEFAEKEVLERTKSRILAKVVKAYFYVFMFTLCHLANMILITVVGEETGIIKEFADCYKIRNDRIDEEPYRYVEMRRRRDSRDVRKIKRKLNLAGKKIIVSFGFIRRYKGFEYGIEAVAEIVRNDQNVALIIAGNTTSAEDMNYLIELKKLVKELNLEKEVIFDTRFIPREEVIDYFSVAEVVLQPYTEQIGASGPLNMAISLGVPAIASSVGERLPSLARLIKLVPPRDVEALKTALNEILSDKNLRAKFRVKLLSHAKRYGWSKIADRLVQVYRKALTK